MIETSKKQDILPVSRRGLAGLVASGAALIALPRTAAAALPSYASGRAVIGFHNDAPWVDKSGQDIPFVPPHATGRFAPDTESLARLGYFI